MIHPTRTKTLLTTTFASLVMELSGLLAQGTPLLDRFVHAEPTPAPTMAFARALSDRLPEVGRRIMTWTLNRLEPDADREAPSQVSFAGRLARRRRKPPQVVGTLFGPGSLWRRLDEPRGYHGRSIHPLELRLGIEAGRATPGSGRARGLLGHRPHPQRGARHRPARPWRVVVMHVPSHTPGGSSCRDGSTSRRGPG
jgi:hypothetical protein